jgi:hypothetical protein
MNNPRPHARSHNPYHRQVTQIHLVQDQEQNRYQIRKYLLLQIYLTCEQPGKHHHRSGQISLSTEHYFNCTKTSVNLEQKERDATRQQKYLY